MLYVSATCGETTRGAYCLASVRDIVKHAIVMASQWIGRGLFWQTSCISVATAVVGLALGFLLIPRAGLAGAVWSTLVVYTFSLLVNGSMALYVERRWRAGSVQ